TADSPSAATDYSPGIIRKRKENMAEYEVFIPAPRDRRGKLAWLNANQRLHWAPKAERTRTWRDLAKYTAKAAKLPTGLKRVHILAFVHKTDKRPYDAHNLYPTAKAAIDGLVDYGLIPDDTNAHLTGPDMRPGEKRDQAGITITIKETT